MRAATFRTTIAFAALASIGAGAGAALQGRMFPIYPVRGPDPVALPPVWDDKHWNGDGRRPGTVQRRRRKQQRRGGR